MNLHILKTIVKRDLLHIFRNSSSLVIILMVLGINVFLRMALGGGRMELTLSMGLVMLGFSLTSSMIGEEKLSKNLDALLISPARYYEIITGKIFSYFIVTVAITVGLLLFMHGKDISIGHTIASIPMGAMIICLFGLVIGLICHTAAMISGVGTFLMLALFLPELLAPVNEFIAFFARMLPTHHVVKLSSLGAKEPLSFTLTHYAFLMMSLVATFFWALSFVKTSSKQEEEKWNFDRSNILLTICLLCVFAAKAFFLAPIKGSFVKQDNGYLYTNSENHVSISILSNDFKMKEYRYTDRFVVMFPYKTKGEIKSEPRKKKNALYLVSRKNTKKLTFDKYVEERIEKFGKSALGAINQKKIVLKNGYNVMRLDYNSKSGPDVLYLFATDKFTYVFGIDIESRDDKHFDELVTFLDESIHRIKVD